jgi:hypothetical protein
VPSFEDPALKAALRRNLGRESAPAALRERIGAMAAGAGGGSAAVTGPRLVSGAGGAGGAPLGERAERPIPIRGRSPLYKLAVAAILILGFGGLAYQVREMTKDPYDYSVAISDSLYASMVEAHRARQAAGTAAAAGDTVASVAGAGELQKGINRPVFVADLTKDGWTFQGGGVRNVGEHQAAQLFFTKGAAAVSVFSLPAGAASGAQEGWSYDKDFNGAPIAGFVKGNGLFCIVGGSADGSLTLDEVKRLLEAHRGEVTKT